VQVATDGSCSVNPGPGGWAWPTETTHASGCQRLTTNQEMELRAILEALRAQPGQPIVILTDSQYAIDCVTSWLPRWRRNGWRTSARRPVKHQPTIEAIAAELDRRLQLRLAGQEQLGQTATQRSCGDRMGCAGGPGGQRVLRVHRLTR
jgi:ribonuclease HI